MDHLLEKFSLNDGNDRLEALSEVIFAFERAELSGPAGDDVLAEILRFINYDSVSELETFIFAIGKHSSKHSVDMLLSLAPKITNERVAWQYLIAYENIVGNSIVAEFIPAFDRIKFYANETRTDGDASGKIRKALVRFC